MNKTDLINSVAKSANVTRKDADKLVNAIFDTIASTLKSGEKVQVAGFGGFEIKQRAARAARNPRTGEAIQIGSSRAISFKPAKSLKDSMNK